MAGIAFNDRIFGFNDRIDSHDAFSSSVGLRTGAPGDVFLGIGPTLGDPDDVFLGIDPRFADRADFLSRLGATLDDGDNFFLGTEDSDVLFALGGDDTIFALGGADLVDAGGGDDAVDGGSGDDRLAGADGDDRLFGGSGNDGLFGSSGNDQLSGGDGGDTVVGGSGDDVLIGGADDDTFDYVFAGVRDSIVGDPSQGNDTIEDFEPGVDRIRIFGLLERLDANIDGRLDESDRRVDVDDEGPESVTIDFTGLRLTDGREAEGTLTIVGVDHLTVQTDAIVGTDIFLF